MPSLLLVRHAQASFGAADYDVLSPTGLEQAASLARDFARRDVRIDRIVSGSLVRQRGTVAPLAEQSGLTPEVDARWNEYDSEDVLRSHSTTSVRLEHAPGDDAPRLSSKEFQKILDGALGVWIGAGADGPAGETWAAFSGRVTAALSELAASLGPGETALVCGSGGSIAAACVALLGVPEPTLLAFNRVTANTGVTKVTIGASGINLVTFNDHSHLSQPPAVPITFR